MGPARVILREADDENTQVRVTEGMNEVDVLRDALPASVADDYKAIVAPISDLQAYNTTHMKCTRLTEA